MSVPANRRKSLPPEIDDSEETYGVVWMRLGPLKVTSQAVTVHTVIIQFWGERVPTRHLLGPQQPVVIEEYDVKCPSAAFRAYLADMKNSCRFEVANVGKIVFGVSEFIGCPLEPNAPLSHFQKHFDVIGKNNRKVGDIKVEMWCKFPLPLPLIQDAQQSSNNPINAGKPSQSLDDRIPNSINLKPVPHQAYEPNKYWIQPALNKNQTIENAIEEPMESARFVVPSQQAIKLKESKKSEPKPAKTPNQLPLPSVAHRKIESSANPSIASSQIAKESEDTPSRDLPSRRKTSSKGDKDPAKDFPVIQKVLTYSSLKQMDMLHPVKPTQQQLYNQFYGGFAQKPPIAVLTPDMFGQAAERTKDEKILQRGQSNQNDQTPIAVLRSRDKGILDEQDISQVHRLDKSEQSIEAQRQILARVVNLDMELDGVRKGDAVKQIPTVPVPKFMGSTRPSGLLLNMCIRIPLKSISLGGNKFTIAYRPYGQKDRVKMGPDLPDPISILCPVGEGEVKKMNKQPMVLEFWHAVSGKFIGMARIDLQKIARGFILNGRLNEIAIKTNLLPTTIIRGDRPLLSIDEMKVGSCFLDVIIGISAQIDTYMNSTHGQWFPNEQTHGPNRQPELTIEHIHPHKQTNPIVKPVQPRLNENRTPIHSLNQSNYVTANNKEPNKKAVDSIQEANANISDVSVKPVVPTSQNSAGKPKQETLEEIDALMEHLEKISEEHIQVLASFKDKGSVSQSEFQHILTAIGFKGCFCTNLWLAGSKIVSYEEVSYSFQQWKELHLQYAKLKQIVLRNLTLSNELKNELRQQSILGVISRKQATKLLSKELDPRTLEKIQDYLPPQFQVEELCGHKNLDFSQNHSDLTGALSSLRRDKFLKLLRAMHSVPHRWAENQFGGSSIVHYNEIKDKTAKSGISLWLLLHALRIINQEMNAPHDFETVSFVTLYAWLTREDRHTPLDHEQNEQFTNKQLNEHKNHQNSSHLGAEHSKNEPENSEEAGSQVWTHVFTISVGSLLLQTPMKGRAIIQYTFPHESIQINSKPIELMSDKHHYPVKCCGTHRLTLNTSVGSYLTELPLIFKVHVDESRTLIGAIDAEDISSLSGKEEQSVPLVIEGTGSVAGRLRVNIDYEKKQAADDKLGKETVYNIQLPKQGFLNYSVTATIESHRIKPLPVQDAYWVLSLDLFAEDPSLKRLYPAASSQLTADGGKTLTVSGNTRLALNGPILGYLRRKNMVLSLKMVYYDKEKGNYTRKQHTIGQAIIPLFGLIGQGGIIGDFALKDKLGMFWALANCDITYTRQLKSMAPSLPLASPAEKYHIILHFVQFIDCAEDSEWITIQLAHNGCLYKTDKITLRGFCSPLKNSSLYLELSPQDVRDLRILPLTIFNSRKQRLAIDINFRPICDALNYDRHVVRPQYFIVVDETSQPVRMRLGMRVIALRGVGIGHYSDCLRGSLGVDITEHIDVLVEANNHKLINETHQQLLKIPVKTYEQMVSALLSNKKKGRLPIDLMTPKIARDLDIVPILLPSAQHIAELIATSPDVCSPAQLISHIEEERLHLDNFRPQFLKRFIFSELNRWKLDKNADYLGVSQMVDCVVFCRKLRPADLNEDNTQINFEGSAQLNASAVPTAVQFVVTLLKANNMQALYNGIKPNLLIRLPQIQAQSTVVTRVAQHVFNEEFSEIVQPQLLAEFQRLKVEVYHASTGESQILIGQSSVSLSEILTASKLPYSRLYTVEFKSMLASKSSTTPATLQIRIEVREPAQGAGTSEVADQSMSVEFQPSRLANIMDGAKRAAYQKRQLFDSSFDDY